MRLWTYSGVVRLLGGEIARVDWRVGSGMVVDGASFLRRGILILSRN